MSRMVFLLSEGFVILCGVVALFSAARAIYQANKVLKHIDRLEKR